LRRRLAAASLAALAVTTAGAATADAAGTAGLKAQVRSATGLSAAQFACFDKIVMKESTWNPRATNASSGAYGLVQALPASKMASAGSDYRTNPVTQAKWGVNYMKGRYGSPCAALAFHNSHGWY
jgi:hypothetical protein